MYIIDGIAYAGEMPPSILVCGIRPNDDHTLWVRFNTGEAKVFDFKPLLNSTCFIPLNDISVWKDVYIDYGVPSWKDGEIDIAPEKLYQDGVTVDP